MAQKGWRDLQLENVMGLIIIVGTEGSQSTQNFRVCISV